jgi:hypothetical protein
MSRTAMLSAVARDVSALVQGVSWWCCRSAGLTLDPTGLVLSFGVLRRAAWRALTRPPCAQERGCVRAAHPGRHVPLLLLSASCCHGAGQLAQLQIDQPATHTVDAVRALQRAWGRPRSSSGRWSAILAVIVWTATGAFTRANA